MCRIQHFIIYAIFEFFADFPDCGNVITLIAILMHHVILREIPIYLKAYAPIKSYDEAMLYNITYTI